jgi:hypothetical protein
MLEEEVRERIVSAYRMFLKNDSHLLEVNANERSLTHKLAEYLQIVFPEYHVDCEYNRIMTSPKTILPWDKKLNKLTKELENQTTTEERKKVLENILTNGVSVYPDIIIHHRGTGDNFLVIEAKKTNNSENDEDKLFVYKRDLHYQFAVFIQFPVENRLEEFSENDFADSIRFL